MYQRPDKSFFSRTSRIGRSSQYRQSGTNVLPKQADINKILKIIQRRVIKGSHLPAAIKEMQAGYLVIPYFKDIYLYLGQALALRLQFERWKLWQKNIYYYIPYYLKLLPLQRKKQHY